MRTKAGTIGNLVGKAMPVSQTEVCPKNGNLGSANGTAQGENVRLRRWRPNGPNAQVEQKGVILAHNEVLLRLDAVDLHRGLHFCFFFLFADGQTGL